MGLAGAGARQLRFLNHELLLLFTRKSKLIPWKAQVACWHVKHEGRHRVR